MGKRLQTRIKKLALAYGTGWEYRPESEEAGSVLTNIFLDMMEDNQWRYEQIWKKQELAFQKAVPEYKSSAGKFSGELIVKVSGQEHGKWLEEGSQAYVLREQGIPVRFQTLRPLQLTAARLRYVIYSKGPCAWLTYEAGEEDQDSFALSWQEGRELAHPVFRWYFRGLCDGMEDFGFEVEFNRRVHFTADLPGKWTVSSGETVYPAEWRQTASGFRLEARTPEFAENLEGEIYEIRLELSPEEELTEEWAETLCGGYVLKAAEEEREPDLCITDSHEGEGGQILPFGMAPEEACCCYLSCDRIMAGGEREIQLRFRENYLTEERLPEPRSREYEKLFKKYPWLRQTETVYDWQPEETLWEYFNGKLWRPLPDSGTWRTGCRKEKSGEKAYQWKRPRDMKACVVEGEEHFYIRLRLRRVRNAYAMYYQKVIPVLEEIRFFAGERYMQPAGQEIPDYREAKTEKMYLGFDRDVTPDNCWYTGAGSCSFAGELIRGKDVRFGIEAFWVELTEISMQKSRGKEYTCFRSNYVPVRQMEEDTGEEDTGEDIEKQQIRGGTSFYLEPHGMGMLEAECLRDICCERAGAPILSGRQAAEHYFAHFGRLLTPMDLELMLQERYPFLQVKSCVFRRDDRTLEVELAYPDSPGEAVRTRMIGKLGDPDNPQEQMRNYLAKESGEEGYDRLTEIKSWLEEVLSAQGPVWLQECEVSVTVHTSA